VSPDADSRGKHLLPGAACQFLTASPLATDPKGVTTRSYMTMVKGRYFIYAVVLVRSLVKKRALSAQCGCLERPFRKSSSGVQLVEQNLGLLEVRRVEALRKSGIDCCKTVGSLLLFPPLGHRPSEISGGAQLKRSSVLLARNF
jgi:hypothetical protein